MDNMTKIKKNTILNVIKTFSGIVFPLISFRYVANVLGTENLGKINYSASIVSYVSLIASLGITTYAIRECAKFKGDNKELNAVASQIFSLNMCSTIVAYIIMFLALLFVPPFYDYRLLIIIQGINVIFTTLGADWINGAMEDFKYIAYRTILFQLIALILILLLVREKSHYYRYVWITVLATSGGNIMNIFYRRKYCKIKWISKIDLKRHIKPVFFMFSLIFSQVVYCSSDITMLGLIKGDYEVGLYSISVKIYTLINTVVASIAFVVMPQMSNLFVKKDYRGVNQLVRYALDCIVVIGFPVVVGVFCLAPELIEIIVGFEFVGASSSLRGLMLALLFSFLGGICTNIILIPSNREIVCLKISLICAIVNVVLNSVLIPKYGLNAAALTTMVAEAVGMIISFKCIDKKISVGGFREVFVGPLLGCVAIGVLTFVLKGIVQTLWIKTILIISISVIVYFGILIITKNSFILNVLRKFNTKIGERRR